MKKIKCRLPTIFLGVIIFLSLAFFNGCAGLDQFEKQVPPEPAIINNALPFIDVPVPNGFNRDQSKSFVYETGENMKVGRLFFNGASGLKPTIEFYQNEMINHKWTPGVSFLADNGKILNYQKTGWDCTVIIQSGWLWSNIEIQIGPK